MLLPPRTRLLHIGPMKTGTTSVQAAARARRDVLLAHGVRYPGTAKMHRRHLGALMGFSVETWRRAGELRPDLMDIDTAGIPSQKMWKDLRAEIDADTERRVFLTHEFVSQADDATAQRVIDGIGGQVHICITLRTPGQMIPSLWAQGLKDDAQTEPYLDWLNRFYGKDPEHPISGRYQRMCDQGQLVQRWARLVGPENVTAIVVDSARPNQLTSALEAMLGLPKATLEWKPTNRSLTAPESELFRQVNLSLRERKASWSTFDRLVFKGAIMRGAGPRDVPQDEARLMLPPWAAEQSMADGRRFAEDIRQSGVRVVGDLEVLAKEPRSGEWTPIDQVPSDLAGQVVAAAIVSGREWRDQWKRIADDRSAELKKVKQELAELKSRDFADQVRTIPANRRAREAATAFRTRELAAALRQRLQSTAGRRLRQARRR